MKETNPLSLQSLSTLCLFTYRAIWFCVHKQLHYCLVSYLFLVFIQDLLSLLFRSLLQKKSFYWLIGFNLFLICFVWMWVYAKFDILLSSLIPLNEEDNDWRRQNCFVSIVHLFTSSNAPIFIPLSRYLFIKLDKRKPLFYSFATIVPPFSILCWCLFSLN